MNTEIRIEVIGTDDYLLHNRIAMWYLSEWYVPKEKTLARLSNQQPSSFPFYLVLKQNDVPVAVGGLSNDVGLLKLQPEYATYGPWLTMLYTVPEHRKKGYGTLLSQRIEEMARAAGISSIYLYTATAESLYLSLNYKVLERIVYRDAPHVVMHKNL